MTDFLCKSDPDLWTSTQLTDHTLARRGCSQCHHVQACVAESLAIARETAHHGIDTRAPDGTWGGILWICGLISVGGTTDAVGNRKEVA